MRNCKKQKIFERRIKKRKQWDDESFLKAKTADYKVNTKFVLNRRIKKENLAK